MKICTKCKIEKSLQDFNRNKQSKDNLRSDCRECQQKYATTNRHKYKESARKWRETHKERIRQYEKEYLCGYKKQRREQQLIRLYNINKEEFDKILLEQNSLCAICKTDKPGGKGDWSVDHDHSTGKIRGLLCNNCNRALGLFKDNNENIKNALLYLNKQKLWDRICLYCTKKVNHIDTDPYCCNYCRRNDRLM